MSDTDSPRPGRRTLPDSPDLEHLRKQAKRLARDTPGLALTAAQHRLAREYGFRNWMGLVLHVRPVGRPVEENPPDPAGLVAALADADADRARDLLDRGADPNHRGDGGLTPLHRAVLADAPGLVELLLGYGARNWVPDEQGRVPLDIARSRAESGNAAAEAIVALLAEPRIDNDRFRAAVEAIDAGDEARLRGLLRDHPELITMRAEEDGRFAGPYFARPRLLEFVAENPIRQRTLPANICEIARFLVEAGSPPDAVDKTLQLVASGCVARECGFQIPLMEVLLSAGADPTPALMAALSQGEGAAARFLVSRGASVDMVAAAGLGDGSRLREALAGSRESDRELARAADLAIKGGYRECLAILLDSGLAATATVAGHPYEPSLLHQAGWYGREGMASLLLEQGADPQARDRQFRGTPADWAEEAGNAELGRQIRAWS